MKKHLLSISFAILVLVAGLYSIASSARTRVLADADHRLTSRAELAASAIDRMLQARMVQVFTFAAFPSLRGFASSDESVRLARTMIARSELASIVAADPNVRAATIVDVAGTVILTTDFSMLADWSERAPVREALAGHLYASVPVRETGETTQSYSAPILNNAGDVAGVLILRITAQELWDVLDPLPNVLVVDEYGVRIADHTDPPQIFSALVPLSPDMSVRVFTEQRYGADMTKLSSTNLVDLANAIQRGAAADLVYRDQARTMHAATWRVKTNAWTVIAVENEDAALAPALMILADLIKTVLITAFVTAVILIVIQISLRSKEKAK
jgi:hypothetical protein